MRAWVLIFFVKKLWKKKLKLKLVQPVALNLNVLTMPIVGVQNILSAKPTQNTLRYITTTAYAKFAC